MGATRWRPRPLRRSLGELARGAARRPAGGVARRGGVGVGGSQQVDLSWRSGKEFWLPQIRFLNGAFLKSVIECRVVLSRSQECAGLAEPKGGVTKNHDSPSVQNRCTSHVKLLIHDMC